MACSIRHARWRNWQAEPYDWPLVPQTFIGYSSVMQSVGQMHSAKPFEFTHCAPNRQSNSWHGRVGGLTSAKNKTVLNITLNNVEMTSNFAIIHAAQDIIFFKQQLRLKLQSCRRVMIFCQNGRFRSNRPTSKRKHTF